MENPRSTRFGQFILPGIIFQSVLIGGAYATGREVVEYGARFGALGIWSILAIGAGFALMAALAFEFARVFKVYDYRRFVKALIGPLWPVFDVLYVVMVIITIAVVTAASGTVVEAILGWPYAVGVILVIGLVGFITARGRYVIEQFKTIGSAVLYTGYVIFAGLVIFATWDTMTRNLTTGNTAATPDASIGTVLFIGILYVGYNLAALPATFFTLDRQTTRRHTLMAGLITGLFATVPFLLTYLAVLGFYPDPAVIEAPVPWLVMLERVGGSALLTLYALVVVWTLIETSTGMIHAIIDRISVNLKEVGRPGLSSTQTAILTVGVLVAAVLLSRYGLIALVAQGYTAMAYGFLLLFALPLLTIGVWKMWKKGSG